VFFRKTRRGKILKVVREHYLRDDLPCGSLAVEEDSMTSTSDNENNPGRLSAQPDVNISTLFPQRHYLLIDANVALAQIDLLETKDGLRDVIVTQTVLEEVRHRSAPVYKRLRDVCADAERRFYIFYNEHHRQTYVERQKGESANDRNDRAIRKAAEWYGQRVPGVATVLLTDDRENARKAKLEGVPAASAAEYVKSLSDKPSLSDKLAAKDDDSQHGFGKKTLFPEHLSPADVAAGIKRGRLRQGVFHVSRTNFLEGNVLCGEGEEVLIQGLERMNRAVDGDVVAVEVFRKAEWSAPAEIILEEAEEDAGDTLEREEAIMRRAPKAAGEERPTGRVVGVVRRKWRQYCGVLQVSPVAGANRHVFVPAEKKIPKVRVETRQAAALAGQRVIVAIDSWPRHSRYPQGHFVRALGKLGDKATENEVLLLEHDIPHSTFSRAVLDCLPKMPWTITAADVSERADLRHLTVCSVDPPGCTDIDDALHCRRLDNGNLEVGVHIADVSHFIKPGTAVDLEAAKRCTTVYLTDRRIDMVPELLSSNLCSLRGGEERLAFSCIWEMTEQAEIVECEFRKSVIKSSAAMTYEEAQNRIDDEKDVSEIAQSLRRLLKLSKIFKERRVQAGALVLASSEVRFDVDSETADPVDVQVKVVHETNSMVEEFMLAANVSAAERIYREFPDCAMLRRHPEPAPSSFDPLVKAGKSRGFEISVENGKQLAESLNAAVDDKNPYFNTMLRMIATRCMMQAVYFASGTIDRPAFSHYGLAAGIYTHFTSPIRRYPDVLVHRLLAASVGAEAANAELTDKKKVQAVAENANYRHRMAQYASRASVNLHTHVFFRGASRDEDGYVLYVRQNAIQVMIPKYGLEGTLFIRSEQEGDQKAPFVFNDEEPSQTCGEVKICLFQKLRVRLSLDSSNVQHEKLVLHLVHPHIPGFSVAPIEEASKRKSPSLEAQVEKKRAKK